MIMVRLFAPRMRIYYLKPTLENLLNHVEVPQAEGIWDSEGLPRGREIRFSIFLLDFKKVVA